MRGMLTRHLHLTRKSRIDSSSRLLNTTIGQKRGASGGTCGRRTLREDVKLHRIRGKSFRHNRRNAKTQSSSRRCHKRACLRSGRHQLHYLLEYDKTVKLDRAQRTHEDGLSAMVAVASTEMKNLTAIDAVVLRTVDTVHHCRVIPAIVAHRKLVCRIGRKCGQCEGTHTYDQRHLGAGLQ